MPSCGKVDSFSPLLGPLRLRSSHPEFLIFLIVKGLLRWHADERLQIVGCSWVRAASAGRESQLHSMGGCERPSGHPRQTLGG